MSRKISLCILVSVMLVTLCPPGCPQESATLRVSLWDYNPRWDSVFFNEFQKKHPNIELKIESESWSNYYTKLNMQMIAHTAPDVMMFNANSMYPYCDKNLLLDISKFIEKDNLDLNAFFSNSVEACTWDDKIYGLPFSNNVSALFLNTNLFKQCNTEIPSNDYIMTWEEFQELCQQLSESIDTNKELSIDYVYIESGGWRELYSTVLQNDALPFDRFEDPQKCLLDTPKAIEACKYYFNLSLKYGYSPTILEYTSVLRQSPSTLFIQGKVPIYLGQAGHYFLTDPNTIDFEVKVIPRPRGKRRVTFVDVTSFAINAQTKHLQDAWKVLKYFVSSEAQGLIARGESMGRRIPSLKEIAYSNDFFSENSELRKVFLDELEHSVPIIKTLKSKEIGKTTYPVLEQLAMEQISVENAMYEITEKTNRVLSGK